jgi:hypothetical protein
MHALAKRSHYTHQKYLGGKRTLRSPNLVEERLTDRAAQRGYLGMTGARRGVVDPRSFGPETYKRL